MRRIFVREPFTLGTGQAEAGPAAGLRNGIGVTDDRDRHLRDKILAVLFTAPGERVNNPLFGVGLNRAVFEPLNELLLTAIEYRIAEGLRRDVGDEILVDRIDIRTAPAAAELLLTITYQRREDRIPRALEVSL
jgi:hypothetical protein